MKFNKSKLMLKNYRDELIEKGYNVSLCNWTMKYNDHISFELHHYIINGKGVIFQIWPDGQGFAEYKEVPYTEN